MQAKDLEKSADLVHKIKHKISILGLQEGYQIAVEHEELLRKNSVELDSQFKETLEKIDAFSFKKMI